MKMEDFANPFRRFNWFASDAARLLPFYSRKSFHLPAALSRSRFPDGIEGTVWEAGTSAISFMGSAAHGTALQDAGRAAPIGRECGVEGLASEVDLGRAEFRED